MDEAAILRRPSIVRWRPASPAVAGGAVVPRPPSRSGARIGGSADHVGGGSASGRVTACATRSAAGRETCRWAWCPSRAGETGPDPPVRSREAAQFPLGTGGRGRGVALRSNLNTRIVTRDVEPGGFPESDWRRGGRCPPAWCQTWRRAGKTLGHTPRSTTARWRAEQDPDGSHSRR